MYIYLIVLLAVILIYITHIFFKHKNYWKSRNVPYVEPLPLFGNYKDFVLLKKHVMIIAQEICQKFPQEPYIGTFFGTDPALLIQDPELLKLVMTKDFHFCNGRDITDYVHREAMGNNLFASAGDYWKVLRKNSSPLFSSSKLKSMFYIIKECADTLESLLESETKADSDPDKRKLLLRFTMDCFVACAFGIQSDTMKNHNDGNMFTTMGEQIFEVSAARSIKIASRSMWPKYFYGLGFKVFTDDIALLFTNLLSSIFKSREAVKSSKNDFVDLILGWKKQKYITGDSFQNSITNEKKTVSIEVTEDLLLSQCMIFFAAGFETTATSLSFLLYELAKSEDAQTKVIQEVDDYFKKNKEIEFECITSMPYTDSCIQESLRMYPVLGIITREVMSDYTLPTGLQLKKGSRIHIPVYHIHYNPEYFPEPEKFRPERFFGEEKKNIKPYTYMPFGEGPRLCLGMRFSRMPTYAALLKIFKNYRVELADDMPRKIVINIKSIVTHSLHGIRLKFVPRQV